MRPPITIGGLNIGKVTLINVLQAPIPNACELSSILGSSLYKEALSGSKT